MCTASGGPKQHPAVPTGSVCGVEGPLVCELWRPPLSVGSASRRGGWGRAAVSCTSAREPGRNSHLLSMFRGNISNGAHRFLWSWWFPPLLESYHGSRLSLAPLVCCAGGIQLAQSCLSLGIALNTGVHLMYSWEG